jgi:DNA-directed RNA polymerase specialized sigma24 family protein
MVRALKKRHKNGQLYVRPQAIEESIAAALIQSPESWIASAAGTDHRNSQYLAPEVVVHLIRHSLRMQDYSTANVLVQKFGERVMRLLERHVKESRAFSSAIVREETLSRFLEFFAEDLIEPDEGVLDFYELRFNRALTVLRAQVIRYERLRTTPLESVSAPELRNAEEEEPEPIELPDLSPGADVVTSAENAELYRLVQALPPDERDAILWKYYKDLDTEATDPTKTTVASLAGVSGSEIRSRLRAAYARLKKRMEEKS